MQHVNWIALTIFLALFAFVTWLGFAAAHWRKGDLDLLHEWGLGGWRFGTIVTWFLIGGDLYTAYMLVAVPALVFGAGARGGITIWPRGGQGGRPPRRRSRSWNGDLGLGVGLLAERSRPALD